VTDERPEQATSVRGLAESSEVSKSSAHRARSRELAARRERREQPLPWVIGRDGKTYSVSDDAHLWRLAYGLSLLAIRKSPEEVADAMSVSVRTVRRWRKRFAPVIEEAQRKVARAAREGRGTSTRPSRARWCDAPLTARPKP